MDTGFSKDFNKMVEKYFPKVSLLYVLNPLNYSRWQNFLLGFTLIFLLVLFFSGSGATPVTSFNKNMKSYQVRNKRNISTPDLSQITEAIQSRKLFKASKKPPPPPKKQMPKGPGIEEKMRALVLVGILDDKPMQAIIEYKKTKETYYLKEGESLFDMKIISVSKGQVVLSYQNETRTLR